MAPFEEVLTDPDIDAIILATPTPTHARLTQQAAAAGKHIFVEKPVAATLAEADAVVRAVGQAGVHQRQRRV